MTNQLEQSHDFNQLIEELKAIVKDLLKAEQEFKPYFRKLDKSQLISAKNLIHYLQLRHSNIDVLQQRLVNLGFASLGRSEAQILAAVQRALRVLLCLAGKIEEAKKNYCAY